jgi:hypothetical protein
MYKQFSFQNTDTVDIEYRIFGNMIRTDHSVQFDTKFPANSSIKIPPFPAGKHIAEFIAELEDEINEMHAESARRIDMETRKKNLVEFMVDFFNELSIP